MLMNYLFELASRHWEGRRLPLNSEKPHCRWPEGSGNVFEGTGSRSSTSYSAPAHESYTPTAWPAFFMIMVWAEKTKHTIIKRLIRQKFLHTIAAEETWSWAGRAARALAMAQVTVRSRRLGDDERPARLAASWRDSTAEQEAGTKTQASAQILSFNHVLDSDGPDTRASWKAAWTQLGPLKREASVSYALMILNISLGQKTPSNEQKCFTIWRAKTKSRQN